MATTTNNIQKHANTAVSIPLPALLRIIRQMTNAIPPTTTAPPKKAEKKSKRGITSRKSGFSIAGGNLVASTGCPQFAQVNRALNTPGGNSASNAVTQCGQSILAILKTLTRRRGKSKWR